MKKVIVRAGMLVVTIFIVLQLATCSILSKAEDAGRYKESDWLTYYLSTEDEIKNAPRISDDYYFSIHSLDGSQPQMTEINFMNATDADPLRKYLASIGYHFTGNEDGVERWDGSNTPVFFYLRVDAKEKEVSLTRLTYE